MPLKSTSSHFCAWQKRNEGLEVVHVKLHAKLQDQKRLQVIVAFQVSILFHRPSLLMHAEQEKRPSITRLQNLLLISPLVILSA